MSTVEGWVLLYIVDRATKMTLLEAWKKCWKKKSYREEVVLGNIRMQASSRSGRIENNNR